MSRLKTQLIKSTLDVLYATAIYRLFSAEWSGIGAIFTLHHVCRDDSRGAFSPNRILEVTPEFLDQTIRQVRAANYDIVTLDEAHRRLVRGEFRSKFVCFTLDDGYVDNFQHAFPVFRKYDAPFTVYVNTGLLDGTTVLWWQLLEKIVRDNDVVEVRLDGHEECLPSASEQQKRDAFDVIYWRLRAMSHASQRAAINAMLDRFDVEPATLCRRSAMSWEMISELAASGLATIGAHTVNHFALSKLSPEEARNEVALSREIIAEHTGVLPRHFAYPYGDPDSAGAREFGIVRDLGFVTATTTRKGLLFPEHADYPHALPRVSLNGEYQHARYVELFLCGAPFALWQRFRRLDVA
jgi:peptidoglycan/xylan/chitin deacetylase (PgdA/CDA1 family)